MIKSYICHTIYSQNLEICYITHLHDNFRTIRSYVCPITSNDSTSRSFKVTCSKCTSSACRINSLQTFLLDTYVSCVCFIQGVQKQHILLVQCVTNGLQRKETWMFTERDTLEKTCIHVLSVRNVFYLREDCFTIWIFIEVNTGARNVADVVKVFVT